MKKSIFGLLSAELFITTSAKLKSGKVIRFEGTNDTAVQTN